MTLTYNDLAEAATFMADQLLAAQDKVHDLTRQLAAAHIEATTLRGALEFEQQRSRELRNRGDYWQAVAAENPPRMSHFPVPATASRPTRLSPPQPLLSAFRSSKRGQLGGGRSLQRMFRRYRRMLEMTVGVRRQRLELVG